MTDQFIRDLAGRSEGRMDLWAEFMRHADARTVAEVGVFRGAFAEHMLANCPALERYYMIDPWRHLEDWNKPANRDDATFEDIFDEAMRRTREHEPRRVVLRGRTTEVIDEIADSSLDFVYIDGDHTLRGITVDLVCAYPKIRDGGWIGGDDLSPSIWQHGQEYEPTLVFPLSVHFAEAVGASFYALPHRQFLIGRRPDRRFTFVDLTGRYADISLLSQVARSSKPADRAPARSRPTGGVVRATLRRLKR